MMSFEVCIILLNGLPFLMVYWYLQELQCISYCKPSCARIGL